MELDRLQFQQFLPRLVLGMSLDGGSIDGSLLLSLKRIAFRMFDLADKASNKDYLDVRRLLVGIVMILLTEASDQNEEQGRKDEKQFEEERILFYFNLFDVDDSETVEYNEFFEMLYAAQLGVQDASWQAVELLRNIDADGNGIITEEELLEAIASQLILFNCFARILCAEGNHEADRSREVSEQPDTADSMSQEQISQMQDPMRKKQDSSTALQEASTCLPLGVEYKTTYKLEDANQPTTSTGPSKQNAKGMHNSAKSLDQPSLGLLAMN